MMRYIFKTMPKAIDLELLHPPQDKVGKEKARKVAQAIELGT
jgi:hypothetical protein